MQIKKDVEDLPYSEIDRPLSDPSTRHLVVPRICCRSHIQLTGCHGSGLFWAREAPVRKKQTSVNGFIDQFTNLQQLTTNYPEAMTNIALKVLTENSNLMVFSLDRESGLFEHANHAFRFFQEIQGPLQNIQDLADRLPVEDRDLLQARLLGVENSPIEGTVVKFSGEGGQVYLELNMYPYRDAGISKIAGYARDVTLQTEFQQAILGHNSKKNAILNILSHDLVGSLAILEKLAVLALETSGRKEGDPLVPILSSMEEMCRSNAGLIRGFLRKEFLSSMGAPLNRVRTELTDTLKDFMGQFASMAEECGISVLYEPAKTPVHLFIDQDKLIQSLNNLLSNALKFTPRGGEVRVWVECDQHLVTICVRDTGIGIPPELKDRVFDKFSSSKRTGLNGEEPHGMGLWAVKTMVEWMGGDIRVDSTVGHGTEFRIVLPITQS